MKNCTFLTAASTVSHSEHLQLCLIARSKNSSLRVRDFPNTFGSWNTGYATAIVSVNCQCRPPFRDIKEQAFLTCGPKLQALQLY